MSNRLDKDREAKLQPERMKFAIKQLEKRGIKLEYQDHAEICFLWKGERVKFFPYSGWHSGKSIIDGRGITDLLKQLI